MPRRRLDVELVRRGLAPDAKRAAEAVAAGRVSVAGNPAAKPATLVSPGDRLLVASVSGGTFVSRGGDKLEAALDRFELDVTGRLALDAGASTGGFTDCLLRRGAARVVAVDVGYGQLAWGLRTDPKVEVLDRTNVRELTDADLPYAPDLVVADLSFITLRTCLPALADVATLDASFVVLVKPQFEAGREFVRSGGVVVDPDGWSLALERVAGAFTELRRTVQGAIASPLRGPAGNVEFLVWADHGPQCGGDPLEVALAEARAIGGTP